MNRYDIALGKIPPPRPFRPVPTAPSFYTKLSSDEIYSVNRNSDVFTVIPPSNFTINYDRGDDVNHFGWAMMENVGIGIVNPQAIIQITRAGA